MMSKVIEIQTKGPTFLGTNDVSKILNEAWLAIGSEPHHLSFIAIMWKSEELRGGRVKDAGRVRILNLAEHPDRVPFSLRPHRGNEIAEPVDGKQGRTIKGRHVKRTC